MPASRTSASRRTSSEGVADHLFVYGTLRADALHPMHTVLAGGGVHAGEASVAGRLYAVSWFPGLVLDPTERVPVRGELWRIVDAAILDTLDAYEGCGPNDVAPFEFVRTIVPAHCHDGRKLDAWVYMYTRTVDETLRVHSGDWLRG